MLTLCEGYKDKGTATRHKKCPVLICWGPEPILKHSSGTCAWCYKEQMRRIKAYLKNMRKVLNDNK